jgi:hypothetical protein
MKPIIVGIVLPYVRCNTPGKIVKIEYLKACLDKYRFHQDINFILRRNTTSNTHYEALDVEKKWEKKARWIGQITMDSFKMKNSPVCTRPFSS